MYSSRAAEQSQLSANLLKKAMLITFKLAVCRKQLQFKTNTLELEMGLIKLSMINIFLKSMTILNIAVAGCTGRMGKVLLEMIDEAPDLRLSAALEQNDNPFLKKMQAS